MSNIPTPEEIRELIDSEERTGIEKMLKHIIPKLKDSILSQTPMFVNLPSCHPIGEVESLIRRMAKSGWKVEYLGLKEIETGPNISSDFHALRIYESPSPITGAAHVVAR